MKNNIWIYKGVALLTLLTYSIREVRAQDTIRIAPGHQKVVSAQGVSRAAIGNPEIADVKALPSSQQVIVTGKKNGSTDLILWTKGNEKKTYSIVVSSGGRDTLSEVQSLLNGLEGIQVKNVGGKIILDGQIFRGSDLDRVHQVMALYPNVTNFTRINQTVLTYLTGEIETRLKSSDILTVSATSGGDTIYLEGGVSKKSDAQRAEQIAKDVYSKIVSNISSGVEVQPLMLIDVKLMEVRTNSLGQIGIKWPSQVAATGSMVLAGSALSSTATIAQGSTLTLNALMENGAAKILSNPKLLCRSGTPASFLAGGEIPIRLVGERVASVQFKKYGVQLEITATTDSTQKVFMEIEAQISDLDSASAIDGIPGILEHRIKTAANLRMGDTVVLGGLIENRSRKNVQKMPFLGSIPILGELFKSRDFQRSESDFLVFMTPIPADPKLPTSSRAVGNMTDRMKKAQKEVELSILD